MLEFYLLISWVKEREEFVTGIRDEYLWGNKFIVKARHGKNIALFFRNWIRSQVNKVSDLHFVDGKVDMKLMYDVIIFKNNIFSELLTMRQALLPYQEYVMTTNRVPYVQIT